MITVVRSTLTRLRPVSTHGKFVHVRSVSRLHKYLSNNDADGCWEVVDNPPQEFNFSRDIIDFWAAEKRRKGRDGSPAFWFSRETSGEPDIVYTFADLSTLSQRVAGFFKRELGLGKGSRLMVILPKTPEFWLVLLAAIRCGTLLTTCTPMLTAKDIKFRLSKFQPDCIIAGLNEMPAVEEVVGSFDCVQHKVLVSKEPVRNGWKSFGSLLCKSQEYEGEATYRDDPALVFFTSGTTGPPKMVEHMQGYYLAHLTTACHVHNPEQHDVSWCIADTGWAKAAWGTFPAWLKGACVFQAQMPRFLPTTTLAVLRDYPITQLCAPPTVYRTLLQQDPSLFQFRSLEDCISAGEPMNPEVMLKWHSLTGVQIREVYGQTETVALCAAPKHHPIKPGSMGIPPRNITLQIHDENGKEVAVGETGLIAVAVDKKRPFGLFSCYRDDPERTTSTFRNGFYYTGDRASVDADGYFWFYSRADDVIISAGYRIGPFEVESVLVEHPAVVECAVVASPDPDRGEVVKAFVVLQSDYKAMDAKHLTEELQQHVKKHTAPYKYPRKVEFVDQLPKTISGKILRNQLREREKSDSGVQH
uniref:medium-chain acyl-CoA ligase n=1 Tax=Amblyomma aureolatum TaxID=187763 RepID=A0A1E1X417_9ACAR